MSIWNERVEESVEEVSLDEEEEEEEEHSEEHEKYKMVLCVRNDLKMGKGKACAQCGHATLGAYESADDVSVRRWRRLGEAKIALRVPNLEELHRLARRASEVGLNNFLVADAGCTQLEPGTETVLAIGPAAGSAIDEVTGHLKLF